MLAVNHFGRRAVLGCWYTQLLRASDDVIDIVLTHPRADVPIDFVAATAALQGITQRFVLSPLRSTQQLHQCHPLPIFQRQQLYEAALRFEYAAVAETTRASVFQRTIAEALQGERTDREHCVLH